MSSRPKVHDVAVVGAGLIGLACARALAAEGLAVALLDTGELGREASWASAGMLAPLAEVPQPGTFFELCRHSRDLWRDYAPALEAAGPAGTSLDYDASGALVLAEGPGHLEALEAAASALGERCQRLSPAAARALMPDLAPGESELLLLPGEHRVDNRALCAVLAATLAAQQVELLPHFKVRAVRPQADGFAIDGDQRHLLARQVVIAAGAWSGQIGGLPPLPLEPVHGQMIALAAVNWPWQGCVRGESFYAVRRRDGRLLVGATVEEQGFEKKVSLAGLAELTSWTRRHFPGLAAHALTEVWSGLRPAVPDRLPVVGRLAAGVIVATAHYRNGILLAPWTAARVADLALGRGGFSELDRRALELFSPTRFTAVG